MRPAIDYSEKLRKQLADEMTLDQALAELRTNGASIFDCIVTVRSLKGCSNEEARKLVAGSQAWADHKEVSKEFASLLWREEELRRLWEGYLKDGIAEPLLQFLLANPDVIGPCEHKHPYMHRLCDVRLNGQDWRVGRCILCDERLDFSRTDYYSSQPGVPYWLTGEMLKRWVEEEVEEPSKDAVDWERYREGK